MIASGVRSSCDASATKRRCDAKATSSRASIESNVSASRLSSSSGPSSSIRRDSSAAWISRATCVMCAIGASTLPGDHPADREARDEERGERAEREVAQVAKRALVHLPLEGLRVDEGPLLGLAAVVDRHGRSNRPALGQRLVAQAEREADVEAGDEERRDDEEDAGVEQRQAEPDRARNAAHASSRSR